VTKRPARSKQQQQSGVALLLCLFALVLLSGIGVFLYTSSGTEVRIAKNYGSSLDAYYAARFGLEEVRDRVSYLSTSDHPGGLADLLPKDIAGNPHGVLYVVNPAPGETIDPTDPNNRYFDDQLCHDYNSAVPRGNKCNVVPGVANWASVYVSLAPPGTAPALKWVRINMKTNRVADPFFVDAPATPAALDSPVCMNGKNEQLSPGGTLPACDSNGMQPVYMLTALAVTPGLKENAARRLLRSEVVVSSIRPPGAVTMDTANVSAVLSNGTSIPQTVVDGRPHNLDGTLATNATCSAAAALSTDSATVTTQLQQALDAVRKGIVDTANTSCNADGSDKNGKKCTAALWWVRGTASSTRFATFSTSGQTSGGSGSGDGGSSGTSGHDGGSSGSSGNDGGGSSSTSTTCGTSTSACYTALNLAAPELYAISATYASPVPQVTAVTGNVPLTASSPAPFIGGPGNQAGSMYQSSISGTLPNEIQILNDFVRAGVSQPNYFVVSSSTLGPTYGTRDKPAIVVVDSNASSLNVQQPLTGYGMLVVPKDLEISASMRWTGVVLVQGGNAQFTVGSGGGGFINGALLLQPSTGSTATLSSGSVPFNISYSCDAIDMAFGSMPFKVLGSSESSY